MTNGKVILAVLAGFSAGTALGLLFAPDRGSDTRKKISKKGKDLANAVSDKIDQKFDELLTTISGKVEKPVSQKDAPGKRELKRDQAKLPPL